MRYLKIDSHLSIEGNGIPEDKKPEYFAVLCCEFEPPEPKRQFFHVAVSRKQLEILRDLIDEYLEDTESKSDLELLAELEALVKSAEDKASTPGYECFEEIWNAFWEITNQIEAHVHYYDPDTSYEEDIKAYLDAARQQIK